MGILINERCEMALPVGDTAPINFTISGDGIALSEGDMLLFAISDPATGAEVLRKQVEIVGGVADLRLTNADTRDLAPGEYAWNARIVTDPELDEDGLIVCEDDADEVVSILSAPARFVLTEVTARV